MLVLSCFEQDGPSMVFWWDIIRSMFGYCAIIIINIDWTNIFFTCGGYEKNINYLSMISWRCSEPPPILGLIALCGLCFTSRLSDVSGRIMSRRSWISTGTAWLMVIRTAVHNFWRDALVSMMSASRWPCRIFLVLMWSCAFVAVIAFVFDRSLRAVSISFPLAHNPPCSYMSSSQFSHFYRDWSSFSKLCFLSRINLSFTRSRWASLSVLSWSMIEWVSLIATFIVRCLKHNELVPIVILISVDAVSRRSRQNWLVVWGLVIIIIMAGMAVFFTWLATS